MGPLLGRMTGALFLLFTFTLTSLATTEIAAEIEELLNLYQQWKHLQQSTRNSVNSIDQMLANSREQQQDALEAVKKDPHANNWISSSVNPSPVYTQPQGTFLTLLWVQSEDDTSLAPCCQDECGNVSLIPVNASFTLFFAKSATKQTDCLDNVKKFYGVDNIVEI